MANDRLSNIAGLFREGKTRTIILTTLFVLVVAILIGFLSIRGRVKGVEAAAGVGSAPGNIQSIPFNAPNEEYARLQEQQNKQAAKQAEKTGESSIPTIVRAGDNGAEPAAVSDTGLGFSGLSRENSDAGTFSAKEFGNGASCPLGNRSSSPLGTSVYDKNGKLIGYASPDGKVRDSKGNIIGTMGPDGMVRDLNGNVIGQTAHILAGTPVYDTKNCTLLGKVGEDGQVHDAAGKVPGVLGPDGILRDPDGKILGQAGKPAYGSDGRLIGFACTDGKVRDAGGNIVGTVGPDGVVRDLSGNIIGRTGDLPPGTSVYGSDGKIMGTLGPDGKVRDANGNVVGTMGVDGIVRDANGNVIGHAGAGNAASQSQPVYGSDGKIIGYVGSDGKVRDASGNIVGTIGADGNVHDANGNIIGHTLTGQPVYGPDGKIIGYLGPDGKVRDANGNIVGAIGADGNVHDANGNIIGHTLPGQPVYGPDGKIIGYLGPDGKVRDANGNILGTMGEDGILRDANGNIIGSLVKGSAGGGVGGVNANEQRRMYIQGDQNSQQALTQMQQAMTQQANQLFSAWSSPSQQLIQGDTQQNQAGNNANNSGYNSGYNGQANSAGSSGTVFIKAGTVYYGVIDTAVNSDEPGPVMATVVSGPYKGGKLLGTLTYQKSAVMLSFNILTLNNYPKSISVNVVAIDQNTARTGLSTETDNHYLYRYGSVFAAAFIQGYGQAFQTSGSTITSNGLSTQSSTPDLTPSGKFFVALGNVGQQFNTQAQLAFNTPPTVRVASGTPVGLLFLADAQLAN